MVAAVTFDLRSLIVSCIVRVAPCTHEDVSCDFGLSVRGRAVFGDLSLSLFVAAAVFGGDNL